MPPNQNPEQSARDRIDATLTASGWVVQDKKAINFHAGPGIAVREYQTDIGPADYVLFVDQQAQSRASGESDHRQLENYQGKQPLNELTALVALIRCASGVDAGLATFDDTVRKNFQSWIMAHHSGPNAKFTEPQLAWLQMIRDHISTSFHLERDDLDIAPFDGESGLGKMFQLFGDGMDPLIAELNEALVA